MNIFISKSKGDKQLVQNKIKIILSYSYTEK